MSVGVSVGMGGCVSVGTRGDAAIRRLRAGAPGACPAWARRGPGGRRLVATARRGGSSKWRPRVQSGLRPSDTSALPRRVSDVLDPPGHAAGEAESGGEGAEEEGEVVEYVPAFGEDLSSCIVEAAKATAALGSFRGGGIAVTLPAGASGAAEPTRLANAASLRRTPVCLRPLLARFTRRALGKATCTFVDTLQAEVARADEALRVVAVSVDRGAEGQDSGGWEKRVVADIKRLRAERQLGAVVIAGLLPQEVGACERVVKAAGVGTPVVLLNAFTFPDDFLVAMAMGVPGALEARSYLVRVDPWSAPSATAYSFDEECVPGVQGQRDTRFAVSRAYPEPGWRVHMFLKGAYYHMHTFDAKPGLADLHALCDALCSEGGCEISQEGEDSDGLSWGPLSGSLPSLASVFGALRSTEGDT